MDFDWDANFNSGEVGQVVVNQAMIVRGIPENLLKIQEKVLEYITEAGHDVIYNIIKNIYGV